MWGVGKENSKTVFKKCAQRTLDTFFNIFQQFFFLILLIGLELYVERRTQPLAMLNEAHFYGINLFVHLF